MPIDVDSHTIRITPSGDKSGAVDFHAIQSALDKLEASGYYADCGAVVLSGTYWINQPLRGGTRNGYPVQMHGFPRAQLNYVGTASSGYIITMEGYDGRGWIPVLRDLTINANYRCRGVLCKHIPKSVLLERCYLRNTVEVAIDAISCWGAAIRETTCNNAIGIGLRTRDFNTGSLESFNVRGYGCYHAAGVDTQESVQLWRHEVEHGKQETEDKYGMSYRSNWPEIQDVSVFDVSGNVVATEESERAGVILHGKCIGWNGGSFENSKYCEYPNLFIQGGGKPPQQRGDTGMLELSRIWMENASNRHARIIWCGDEYGQNTAHRGLSLSRCYARDETQSKGTCRAFLELRGRTENTRIVDCYQQPTGKCVVGIADGEHSGIKIDGMMTYSPTIQSDKYIQKV